MQPLTQKLLPLAVSKGTGRVLHTMYPPSSAKYTDAKTNLAANRTGKMLVFQLNSPTHLGI
jgi:hypothetical protein